MVWLIGFGATLRDILRVKISKKLLGQQKKKKTKSCIFKGSHCVNGSSEPNNP